MLIKWFLFSMILCVLVTNSLSKYFENLSDNLIEELISSTHDDESWIVSTASIELVLEMLYVGSSKEQRNKVMKEAMWTMGLCIDEGNIKDHCINKINLDGGRTWKSVSKFLFQKSTSLTPSYQKQVSQLFNASFDIIDVDVLTTINKVNSWVAKETNNVISEFLSSDDVSAITNLIILNAVYFKGDWEYAFDEDETELRCFNNKKKCTDVEMMYQKRNFKYMEDDNLDAKLVQLPYSDSNFSMVIILPNREDGLQDTINKFKMNDLRSMIKKMTMTNVAVSIPKFSSKYKSELSSLLSKLGFSSFFDASADFSPMTSSKGLFANSIIHQAHITISEKGTVAAAATAAIMARSIFADDEITFDASHPFFYAIMYQEKLPLFIGSYKI